MSLVESLSNVFIGIGVGFVSNLLVLPLFGFEVKLHEAAAITLIYTIISIARSYVMRRVFESIRVKQVNS